MVPFQAHPLSPNNTRKTAIPDHEFDISSKKRKWDDKALPADHHDHQTLDKTTKSIFDIELHLETPLPLEWERCLDIQVYIYFALIYLFYINLYIIKHV